MAKIRQITLGGTTYELKDNALTTIVNAIMAGTQPTGSATVQGETYWLPTSTDETRWNEIKDLIIFNLKGSVASYADLPANASAGDVYLIANATSGFTEEWVKTDSGWEMLGTVSGSIDISGKADKSEMIITQGTGANADKTTIQLKSGTSATVLNAHQDISGKADKTEVKNLFDGFTTTLITGTSDEYKLTIPTATINQSTGALE